MYSIQAPVSVCHLSRLISIFFCLSIASFAYSFTIEDSINRKNKLVSKEKKTVVIVGSGIAGLSSAYFLVKDYKVIVLEQRDRTGGNHFARNASEQNMLNLGASYVLKDDSYSIKLFEKFKVPLKPLLFDQAWSDFDHTQGSRVDFTYIPYFLPLYFSLRLLNRFFPAIEHSVTVESVLNLLPRRLRRSALFSISYDPFVKDDLGEVLFVPYVNYLLWIYTSGFVAPWGTLTNDHLYPYLREHNDFELIKNVKDLKILENDFYRPYRIETDSGNIYADYIIYAGYPREAAKSLRGIISKKLSRALKESFYRTGQSILIRTPKEFREKSLYFVSRMHEGKEVNAMIDHQGSADYVRIFFMDNCPLNTLLEALDLTDRDIIQQSDEFIHYATDHRSMYSNLRKILKNELSALDKKRIFFSSYAYHSSGFRNADQSISMSTGTAKKIFDHDKRPYSKELIEFLKVRDALTIVQQIKRSALGNSPY